MHDDLLGVAFKCTYLLPNEPVTVHVIVLYLIKEVCKHC